MEVVGALQDEAYLLKNLEVDIHYVLFEKCALGEVKQVILMNEGFVIFEQLPQVVRVGVVVGEGKLL
jgi:hypothetical protein